MMQAVVPQTSAGSGFLKNRSPHSYFFAAGRRQQQIY
jgi:hypothetical protein